MTRHSDGSFVARRACGLAALALVLLVAAPSRAGDDASTTVNGFSGALMSPVPVAVPPYHGIEPQVGLGYSSQAPNGFVGVGWNLQGPSVVERAAPGRGAPQYLTTDVFYLDGMELIPCAGGSTSPSCTTGGTHSTRIESFQQVKWDSAANKWYVTTRNGTKSTYSSIFTSTLGTYRWGLTEVRDPSNNYVTYTWACVGYPHQECYLDRINYNNNKVQVKFYKETRTDVLTYAIGTGLGSMGYRLKSIDVNVGGSCVGITGACSYRARAYKLTYSNSYVSQRSTLYAVQQFGSTATVDTAGTVAGTSYLPAMTISATGGATSMTRVWGNPSMGTTTTALKWLSLDFNGDGMTDMVKLYQSGSYLGGIAYGSTGCGLAQSWSSTNMGGGTFVSSYHKEWLTGDVNGDGMADVIQVWNSGGKTAFKVYKGTATGLVYTSSTTMTQSSTALKWFAGDVDGDGKTDIVQVFASGSYTGIYVYKSNGSGFTYSWGSTSMGTTYSTITDGWLSGDVNGDGKLDIMQLAAGVTIRTYISNGTGYSYAGYYSTGNSTAALSWLTGDFNGDGKTDIIKTYANGSYLGVYVYASNGKSYQQAWYSTSLGYTATSMALLASDVNGDGRADIIQTYEYGTTATYLGMRVFTSRGTSYAYAWGTSNIGHGSKGILAWLDGDIKGNGTAGLIVPWSNGTTLGVVVIGSNSTADLVTTLNNGLGGSTTVAYAPSTAWSDNVLPLGTIFQTAKSITINDGRGDAQTTNYTYEAAKFDFAARDFLGFRKAVTTLAATGAYSETYYWQRVGSIAKPEVIYKRQANGAILSYDKFFFTEDTTAPYTSPVSQVWSYECNGDAVCKKVLTTYGWDQYGNMTTEYQYGNYDASGDERTAVRSFAVNTTKYIVGYPAYEEIRSGIGTGGTLLARVKFYHDGATAETTAPTKGLLTKRLVWNDQTGGYVGSTYLYDAYGNRTQETDPWNSSTSATYDSTYHVYRVTGANSVGHTESRAYNYALGRETSRTDVNGYVTTTAYDPLGRATLVTDPDGGQLKIEHLSYGSASAQKVRRSKLLPGGIWAGVDSYFDGAGRVYKTVDVPTSVAVDTVYGSTGKVWKRSRPYYSTSGSASLWDVYTYDELGRKVSASGADGTSASVTYGDWATVVTHQGKVTTTSYDAYSRVTNIAETAAGQTRNTQYRYDLLGRRTYTLDPANGLTTVTYGSLGNVLGRSDPDQGAWTYGYDAYGRVTSETDARLKKATLAYDGLGRLTYRSYADGTSHTFYFDETGYGASKGKVTRTTTSAGVTRTAYYDSMGRTTQTATVVDGTTYTVKRSYDVAGRLWSLTYPDNEVVGYTYGTTGTAIGRLTSMGNKLTGVTYTTLGKVASMTYGNGVTTSYGYDAYADQVTSIQFGALARIDYGYNSYRQISSVSTSAQLPLGSWTYTYDTWGRLTRAANTADSAKTQSYYFDLAGRMTNQTGVGTYTYGTGKVHAPTGIGGVTQAYDANGNLTAGGGRTLGYDNANRVTNIVSGGQTTTFVYDAEGKRVKKVGPSGTVVYVDDVYEKRGTVATKYYVALGQRVAKAVGTTVSYLHVDHLGSTRLVSSSSGAQVKRYDHSPYGTVIGESGTSPENHRFTGQEADDETGLLFYQSRFFDPRTAQFLQVDTLVPNVHNPDDLDPYRYCYNNPVGYSDPSGHAPVVAIFAAIGAYMAAHAAVAIACFVIGTALTFTNNPFLQTVGMVLAGIGSCGMSGPLLGLNMAQSMMVATAVALATSPISPLDANVKKVIGWAYTAWGVVTAIDNMAKKAQAAKAGGSQEGLTYEDPALDSNAPAAYKTEVFKDGKLVEVDYNVYGGEKALRTYGPQLNEVTPQELANMAALEAANPGSKAVGNIGMGQVLADIRTLDAGITVKINLVIGNSYKIFGIGVSAGLHPVFAGTVLGPMAQGFGLQGTWFMGLKDALKSGLIVKVGKDVFAIKP